MDPTNPGASSIAERHFETSLVGRSGGASGSDHILKAIRREKELKGWRRSKKIALIEECNPRWADLAELWGAEMLMIGEAKR